MQTEEVLLCPSTYICYWINVSCSLSSFAAMLFCRWLTTFWQHIIFRIQRWSIPPKCSTRAHSITTKKITIKILTEWFRYWTDFIISIRALWSRRYKTRHERQSSAVKIEVKYWCNSLNPTLILEIYSWISQTYYINSYQIIITSIIYKAEIKHNGFHENSHLKSIHMPYEI